MSQHQTPTTPRSVPCPATHYERAIAALEAGAYKGLDRALRRKLLQKLRRDLDAVQAP